MSNIENESKEITRPMQAQRYQIPLEERTLTALTKLNGRVYVYCGDRKTQQQFIEDAENEYFHYRDGVSLPERKPGSIMALNQNRTVNFVGYLGTMAFYHADHLNAVPLIKVDYRKYAAGYQNFIYKP